MANETWVETIHQLRTNDTFHYEVGPDPDGLGLEIRYLEVDPDTKDVAVKARIGFSEQEAALLGELLIRASRDYVQNEEDSERRRGK